MVDQTVQQPPLPTRVVLTVFAATIFLSAGLLFQVELIIGKYLLPWFGGSAAVWATSMLVFQALLFGGYAYAHLLSTRLCSNLQPKLHAALVGASVLALVFAGIGRPSPITPGSSWRPETPDHPIIHIFAILMASVAIPFFVLSSAGPLLQKWYTRRTMASPYRLYAISNLGSLFGLFAYPVLVEPYLRIRTQAWVWSALYLLSAVGTLACARWTQGSVEVDTPTLDNCSGDHPNFLKHIMWMTFAACASTAFLAVTNEVSEKIAPLPMVWVLPLGTYLISFILCFGNPLWYQRNLFHALFAISALASLFAPYTENTKLSLGNLLVLLFAICMICHGELVRLKPAAKYLTSYYLSISAGGAIGGLLVAIIAPILFHAVWELAIAMCCAMVLMALVLADDKQSWLFGWSPWNVVLIAAIIVAVPVVLPKVTATPQLQAQISRLLDSWKYYELAVILFLPAILAAFVFRRSANAASHTRFRPVQVAAAGAALLFAYTYVRVWQYGTKDTLSRTRNFYGTLSVVQLPTKTLLIHGQTIHGEQSRIPGLKRTPTAYFARTSGIGRLLTYHPKREANLPMRIGIVGLGAGTISAYGRPGDTIRYYEIDPAVLEVVRGSHAWFSYLDDSSAHVDVVLGDARIALQREADRGEFQKFDVLVLDAFSGDAIPVHLLTKEAFQLYFQHLSGPEAVLAVHISSAMLDLRPVLVGIAREFHMEGKLVQTADPINSAWVILSRDPASVSTAGLLNYGRPLPDRSLLWTDDFSNLVQVLR